MDNSNNLKSNLKNICIFFVILFISFICIVKSLNKTNENAKMLYAYNTTRNANYKVYIKDNTFIEQNYIGTNQTYITDLVDYIDTNFNYNYSVTKKSKGECEYKIVANINVEYNASGNSKGTKLWTKEYELLEPKKIEVDTNIINVNENIKVDFNKYNKEIIDFKEQFGLPIKADLEIKMIATSKLKLDDSDKIETDNSIITLKMDLNQPIFNIKEDFEKSSSAQRFDENETKKSGNLILLSIGIILLIIAFFGILNIIRKIASQNRKSDYEIALNRILKNYGDIVAEVVTPTSEDNAKIIEVKNFDQLLDIEEEIRMPILFYERIEGQEGEFTIIYDNVLYRYILGGK